VKEYIPSVLVGLMIAAIWGYFSDLRQGQVERFVKRYAGFNKKTEPAKNTEQ
jgi:hypothetical protein